MKNLTSSLSIEILKTQIRVEEFRYKTALSRHKNYVVLKRIKQKIRELESNLQRLAQG